MGNPGARYLAAVCAAALAVGASGQTISQAELSSLPGELQLIYCANVNLERLKDSKDPPEAIATAAVAMCKTEKARVLADNRGSFAAWEFHRRTTIDNLIALIVQRRINTAPR
jgi:hypothetical protein